jgi:phage/plasmid-like protein (TIGR03299 family)
MSGIEVTLADRRKPWDVASWSDGQKPTSSYYATAAEMLEVAGLANLNVTKRPMLTLDHDGQPLTIPGRFANVDSRGIIRGVNLTERYVNIQMEDAFGFGDALVDSGEAKWERAGSASGILFGCMELTHLGVNVPGDQLGGDLIPYLMVLNSFGGQSPLQGIIAFIRPVCINTFEAARGTKTPYRFNIRHTGTLDGKLAMAREALGITFRHVAEVRELTTQLASMKLVERQVRNILAQAFADPDKGKWTESQDPSPLAVKVLEHYQATPTIDGIRGTGWGLMNAVTEYMDHVQEYRPRAAEGSPLELRAQNLLVGKAQDRKEAVLAGILRTK